MKAISPEILQGIKPEIEIVNRCIMDAVKHYQAKLGDESAKHSALTKASYIRDQILENITKEFYCNSKVDIKKKRGMITLVIYSDPVIILKFKKFDKHNRICSTRTRQSFMYVNQMSLFPELNRIIHLHAGYKWDDTGTSIECVIGLPNNETEHAWTVVLQNSRAKIADKNIEIQPIIGENIGPNIKLKVKDIRKQNEQAG